MKSQTRLRTGLVASRQSSSNETSKLFSRTKLEDTRLRVASPKASVPLNPQRVERTPLPSICAQHSQKTAAILLRKFVYRCLRHAYDVLKRAKPKPKPNLSLLIAKRKRLIHSCFLSIFSFSCSRQFQKLSKRNAHNPTAKIIAKVYNILEKNTKKVLFTRWKQYKTRENLGKNLARMLDQVGRRAMRRYWLVEALGKIKIEAVKVWQRGQLLRQIPQIVATRNKRVLRLEFAQIPLQILVQSCLKAQIQLRQKQQALVQSNKSKKEALYKLREQMKSIRITVEQARNAKNLEQKRKDKNASRVAVMEEAKVLAAKIKEEQLAVEAHRKELDGKENQVGFRYQLRFRSDCAESACFQFVRILTAHSQKMIKLSAIEHLVPADLMKAFCQSVAYLEMDNNLLQMQINYYETGDTPTQEADYYELHYENKVLKEVISCFIKKEYSNYKHGAVKNNTAN